MQFSHQQFMAQKFSRSLIASTVVSFSMCWCVNHSKKPVHHKKIHYYRHYCHAGNVLCPKVQLSMSSTSDILKGYEICVFACLVSARKLNLANAILLSSWLCFVTRKISFHSYWYPRLNYSLSSTFIPVTWKRKIQRVWL